jgi:hypothetical protein
VSIVLLLLVGVGGLVLMIIQLPRDHFQRETCGWRVVFAVGALS